jgi:hypothetical protein
VRAVTECWLSLLFFELDSGRFGGPARYKQQSILPYAPKQSPENYRIR